MKQKLFFLLTLYTTLAFAQQEASVWYFGEKAGLKFHPDGSFTALTDGQLSTLEGCATLSDTNGGLLFYTDGKTIWDKNHQPLVNGTGLLGHDSSTQSATIVQKPGSSNLFYVFTLDAKAGNNGFRYSEVDITQNGGLGAVTSNKNTLIYAPSCEKLSVVKHANGTDFWIITHDWNNNTFFSYLLTSSGLVSVPIISNSGAIVDNSNKDNSQGYMKISPDAKKLVLCHQFLNLIELFNFNSSTGAITNPQTILNDNDQVYGVEFSPNGKVLYASVMISKNIYQFDLSATNIASSAIVIASLAEFVGALQLGPNNKIYIAKYMVPYLGVINNPDVLGSACNLQDNAIDLSGRKSKLGLPAFNQSFFYTSFSVQNFCLGSNTQFAINSVTVPTSVLWDFGDNHTSTNTNPIHQYTTTGNYKVTLTATTANGTSTKEKQIIISAVPILANVMSNQVVCGSANTNYDLSQHNAYLLGNQPTNTYGVAYFSSLADANAHTNVLPTNYALQPGTSTFYAKVYNLSNTNCSAITSFTISLSKPSIANATTDYVICENLPYNGTETFDLSSKNSQVLNVQNLSDFTISYYASQYNADHKSNPLPLLYTNTLPQETLFVRIENNTNSACFATTTLNIKVVQQPTLVAVSDFIVCDDSTNDGIARFDLSQKTIEILHGQSPSVFSVKYYLTQSNAQDSINEITNPIANTTTNQTIYYAIAAIGNSSCRGIASFKLVVSQLPIIHAANAIFMCDDTTNDGLEIFNLQSNNAVILGTQNPNQFNISYHSNENDANTNSNLLPLNYKNTTSPQIIFVRLENNQNPSCFATTSFQIGVYKFPIANQPSNLITCDDASNDGIEIFDLTTQNATILGTQPTTDYTISYHKSQTDANSGTNALPTNYQSTSNSQTIYVRITNILSNTCFSKTSFQLIVKKKPELNMQDSYSICEGTSITITAPSGFSTYSWSNGSTRNTTTIIQAGNYSVTVTKNYGDIVCETIKTIVVYNSNKATITKIETQDWSDTENNIAVYATGDGDYEYSIDGVQYQDSPQFFNLSNGQYTVYVRDKKGCGIKTDEVFLLMYPKYFTPNGDNFNDTWNITYSNLEPKMKIIIYDRYGKIIHSFNGLNLAWDGKLNGELLPSDDYWFVVQRENGKEYKGHFALKR